MKDGLPLQRDCRLGFVLWFKIEFGSQSHRPQTSAVWSLHFSTTACYNMSMLWLDTIPMWLCEWDLRFSLLLSLIEPSHTEDGLIALRTSVFLHGLLPSSNNYLWLLTDNKFLSSYLNPRRRQRPYEPSWPGFPRSPVSTPHSTAGAADPWKPLSTGYTWQKKLIQIYTLHHHQVSMLALRCTDVHRLQRSYMSTNKAEKASSVNPRCAMPSETNCVYFSNTHTLDERTFCRSLRWGISFSLINMTLCWLLNIFTCSFSSLTLATTDKKSPLRIKSELF